MRKAGSVNKAVTKARFDRRHLLAAAAAMAVFLTACSHTTLPQDALNPAGSVARQEHSLWHWVFPIAVFVFVLVEGLIVYIMIRYRARSADETPVQTHGNFGLELTWTVLPALLLGVIGI